MCNRNLNQDVNWWDWWGQHAVTVQDSGTETRQLNKQTRKNMEVNEVFAETEEKKCQDMLSLAVEAWMAKKERKKERQPEAVTETQHHVALHYTALSWTVYQEHRVSFLLHQSGPDYKCIVFSQHASLSSSSSSSSQSRSEQHQAHWFELRVLHFLSTPLQSDCEQVKQFPRDQPSRYAQNHIFYSTASFFSLLQLIHEFKPNDIFTFLCLCVRVMARRLRVKIESCCRSLDG